MHSALPYYDELPEFTPCAHCDQMTPTSDLNALLGCSTQGCKVCEKCEAAAYAEDED